MIVLLSAAFGLLIYLLWRQSQPRQRSAPSTQHPSKQHPLEFRLLNLLNGDRATASRLLNRARSAIPGKSSHWYYEKVIYDLERDRH